MRHAEKTETGGAYDPDKVVHVEIEEAWRRILEFERWTKPQMNVMQAAEALGVCPEGLLVSRDVERYIETENLCRTYHMPPVAGSLAEMPAKMQDAFLVIDQARTVCRNEQMERMRQEMANK